MEIKESFIQAVTNVLPLFKIRPQFKLAMEENFFTAASEVNILNSFSHTLQGNIVMGLTKARALKIASSVKGINVSTLDDEVRNILGEIATLTVNVAISKFQTVNAINISPPVVINGDNLFLMISRITPTRLDFQFAEGSDGLSVIYYIEKGCDVI